MMLVEYRTNSMSNQLTSKSEEWRRETDRLKNVSI